MKISLKWLCDYIELEEYFKKPDALADILTRSGLEVESIENKAKDFENVVVGLILEKDKHPNADKLSLCRVTTGQGVVHQIVCGAQNHKSGDRVIVALPGAILPGNFSIQKSVIRSVESYGMLCSYKELGMADDSSEGIAILPADAPIGGSYADFKGLNDIIFEIKVTPNRADVLSHFGLARELSSLLNKEIKKPNLDLSKMNQSKSTKDFIKLEVENSDLCPRYTGRYIAGIKVGPSPEWLKQRLEILGFKSINNIVDITNFILQDMGQPLHAFDADQIPGKKIKVGLPIKSERFITLDGTELCLSGEELSIKDESDQTLCLAGLIGGKNSGVTEGTQNIFLESAYFVPFSIRKSSRTLGVETESGYRFARGVDPEMALTALNRATVLINEIAGGNYYGGEYDVYPHPVKTKAIEFEISRLTERLGYEGKADVFNNWMSRLGCQVETISAGVVRVLPPSYRVDLESEMDLVEEYARLQGYEHIPESLPAHSFKPTAHDPMYINMLKSYRTLRDCGFTHAFNYSFISEKEFSKFNGENLDYSDLGMEKVEGIVKLKNPLNEDLSIMRPQLTYGLFRNALTNIRYGNEFGRLFEVGKIFNQKSGSLSGSYAEKQTLGLVSWGQKKDLWQSVPTAPQVFIIKEAVEALLKEVKIKSFSWKQMEFGKIADLRLPAYVHPYQTAVLYVEGKKRGFISAFHPMLLEQEKIRIPMAFGEFDFENMVPSVSRVKRVQNISRFPMIERDLALVMDKYQPIEEVFEVIRKITNKHLLLLEVFDIYEGDKLEVGKKSIALKMKFQDAEKTLEEDVVNQYQVQILSKLKDSYQINLRS